jgi:hypothetical protein
MARFEVAAFMIDPRRDVVEMSRGIRRSGT